MGTTLYVDNLAHGGHGVGRIDRRVYFVPYAAPGDELEIDVVKETRGVRWAQIKQVLTPSPERQEPCCDRFGECGGCNWLHLQETCQLEWKRRIVNDCFQRIARLDIETDIKPPTTWMGYRTRARFHGDGAHWGFYARGSHDVVDLEECPLCHPRLNEALRTLRQLPLRAAVEIIVNPDGHEVLFTAQRGLAKLKRLFASRQATASPAHFLYNGAPVVCGAFSQPSLLLNTQLIQTVHAAIGEARSILDLYCGAGNLSLGLTDHAQVTGLDHNAAAIQAASSLGRGDYHVGDESVIVEALCSGAWDVVLLDPPRTGAKQIADALAKADTQAIVYVSCDPATLARDARTLAEKDWRVVHATVVDMFPQTSHIETLCRLERA